MLLDESAKTTDVLAAALIPGQGNEWRGEHRARIAQGDTDPDRPDIHPEAPTPTGIVDTGPVRTASGGPAAVLLFAHADKCPL
jgi:hypothetical protein